MFALVALTAAQGPVLAQTTVKNWQKIYDQNVSISQSTGFSASGGSATLTGIGSAMLDSGAVWVNPGATITVTFTNTADPMFQQCVGALSATGYGAYISGHGYYSLGMQNGAVKQATVTLEALTTCNGGTQ